MEHRFVIVLLDSAQLFSIKTNIYSLEALALCKTLHTADEADHGWLQISGFCVGF